MAVLTTNDTLFGARGVSDLGVFTPFVAYRREIDFAKSNATTDNFSLLPLPKGFVLTGGAVEVVEACDGTSNTITLKLKADSSSVGSATSVGTAGTVAISTTPKAVTADDMLCFAMAAATTAGKVAVTVTGYFVNEASLATAQCPAWRARLQDDTLDNVSGGQLDPRVPDKKTLPSA